MKNFLSFPLIVAMLFGILFNSCTKDDDLAQLIPEQELISDTSIAITDTVRCVVEGSSVEIAKDDPHQVIITIQFTIDATKSKRDIFVPYPNPCMKEDKHYYTLERLGPLSVVNMHQFTFTDKEEDKPETEPTLEYRNRKVLAKEKRRYTLTLKVNDVGGVDDYYATLHDIKYSFQDSDTGYLSVPVEYVTETLASQ